MAAITANTTTLSIDGGSTQIADVTSISPISLSLATLDTSNLDSTWRTRTWQSKMQLMAQ